MARDSLIYHIMVCDSTGKVYVADTSNDRIKVLTPEGNFLSMFWMPGGQQSVCFYGIAIDTNDMVYVSDSAYRFIYVFTSEGQFVISNV